MITFRVELWCQGCERRFYSNSRGNAHDNAAALPELAEYLLRDAMLAGWTIDGAAHWCPRCTRVLPPWAKPDERRVKAGGAR